MRVPRRSSAPCLVEEILLQQMASGCEGFLATPSAPAGAPGPLTRGERLLGRLGVFLIVSWNLIVINLDRSPERLWSLFVVVPWAALLVIHCLVHLVWLRSQAAGPASETRAHHLRHHH